jgi:ketosteroid isomerase-like protein
MALRILMPAALTVSLSACQPSPPSPAPDANVARLVERQAIDQLIAGDYPRALDSHDYAAYAALFTEDGELSLQGQRAKGRQAVQDFVAALPTEPRVIHVISNLSYRIEGDTATGGAYWQDIGIVGPNVGVLVAGHYEDALRKVGGEWRIAKRDIVIEFLPTVPAQ